MRGHFKMENNKVNEAVKLAANHHQGKITSIYFTACGGSLVDFYVSKYFLEAEAKTITTGWYNASEFVNVPPAKVGEDSIVFICSHSGDTPETVEAAKIAQAKGAFTIGLTFNENANLLKYSNAKIIYEWGNEEEVVNNPMAITLDATVKLLQNFEDYQYAADFDDGFKKIDTVISRAIRQVQPRTKKFAQVYQNETMFYVLGSGPSFGHAYGFSICSLMEMQWLNSSAIHSGEYFHGPFEVTDKNLPYILLKSLGRTRVLDERAERFLAKYAQKVEVVDAKELGLDLIDDEVSEYFSPILFYTVLCEYRAKLAAVHNHSLDVRRYMGKVEY